MQENLFVELNELIGKQVKKFREEADKEQEELGKAIGKSRKFISELEAGWVDAQISDLCNIAKALSKNLDDIISTAQFHDISKVGDREVIYVVTKKERKPYNNLPPPKTTE